MPDGITAYPLCWPTGYGRRPRQDRKVGKFATNERRGSNTWRTASLITVANARRRLQDELDRIGAQSVILSSNIELRLDGQPRSDRRSPTDPGVALYFTLKGRAVAMPCDTYEDVAQSIAALAAHIEATRAIERHGVASIEAMFTGFMALRAPGPKPWREVLGFTADARPMRADIEAKRRTLARQYHPDVGGSEAAMAEINAAVDRALQEINT